MKYTDPDGRLSRDKNGKINFASGYKHSFFTPFFGKIDTIKSQIETLDVGTEISAYKNLTPDNPGYDADCHGCTFADGEYWIDNDQVDLILKGDSYSKVQAPEPGDVVIYRKDGEVQHSLTVVEIKVNEDGLKSVLAKGLGGVYVEQTVVDVNDGWFDKSANIEYYRKSTENAME